MRKIWFVLMILPLGDLEAQYLEGQSVKEAEACLRPWLEGLDYVVSGDSSQELKSYKEILANRALGKLVVSNGQSGVQYLSAVPDRQKSWIGVVPVCSETDIPPVWKAKFSESGFLAEYMDQFNIVILRGSFKAPRLLRGIVLIHEMRHKWQLRNLQTPVKISEYAKYGEVDAYEFEFGVLDRLNIPGYASLLRDEIQRVKNDYAQRGRSEPNTRDPRITQAFQSSSTSITVRKLIASEIFVRANFKLFDEGGSREAALRRKIELLDKLGYK